MGVNQDTMPAKLPLKNVRGRESVLNASSKNVTAGFRSLKKIKRHTTVREWKICISSPFLNCGKIHPIQQKKVEFLINSLKTDQNVQRIVIFGSSVTDRCHAGSDVDIFVCICENRPLSLKACTFVYDLWTNFTVDKRMLEEINRTGVVVYERNAA